MIKTGSHFASPAPWNEKNLLFLSQVLKLLNCGLATHTLTYGSFYELLLTFSGEKYTSGLSFADCLFRRRLDFYLVINQIVFILSFL